MPYTTGHITAARLREMNEARDLEEETRQAFALYAKAYEKQQKEEAAAKAETSRDYAVPTRLLATALDVQGQVVEGALGGVEGIVDAATGLVGLTATSVIDSLTGANTRRALRKFIEKDWVGTGADALGEGIESMTGLNIEEASYQNGNKVGQFARNVERGIGNMLPAVAVSIATGGAAAPTAFAKALPLLTTGVSAGGQSMQAAYRDGAGDWQGLGYGVASGAVEATTEKLFGGVTKFAYGKGWLDSVVPAVATKGAARVARSFAEEGMEEAVAELADPALQSIYKGREALSAYTDPELYKDTAESFLVGGATSLVYENTVGRAMAKKGYGHVGKEADVEGLLSDIEGLERKRRNAQKNYKLTPALADGIETQLRNRYRDIESILESTKPERHQKMRETFGLSSTFDESGKLNERIRRRPGTEEPTPDPAKAYTYDALTSKPDMPLTVIDDTPTYEPNAETRKSIIDTAMKNAASVGRLNENGNAVIHIRDTDTDVIVGRNGIKHGLDRRLSVMAPVALNIGTILENAVRLNELNPRSENVKDSYVLIGAAKNQRNQPYVVEFVVNRHTNEITSVDVLYSTNAKKEPTRLDDARVPEQSDYVTGSNISIAQLLDFVNRYFPDILPKDVLTHYGHTERPKGALGESARYARKSGQAEHTEQGQMTLHPEFYKGEKSSLRRALDAAGLVPVSDPDSLSATERANYRAFLEVAEKLDDLSGGNFDFVLVEENDRQTGSYVPSENVILISRETLRSAERTADALCHGWFGVTVEETLHMNAANAGLAYGIFSDLVLRDKADRDRVIEELLELDYFGFGDNYSEAKKFVDRMLNKRPDRMTEAELADRALFFDELIAHLGRDALSTEHFYRRLVETDRTAAQKLLDALRKLKERLFKSRKKAESPVEEQVGERVLAMENAFMGAVLEAGCMVNGEGRIVGIGDEEEETSFTIRFSKSADKSESKKIIRLINEKISEISQDLKFDVMYSSEVEEYQKKSDYVREVFRGQGNMATNQTIGVVELEPGANDTIMHGYGHVKLAAIPAIKTVIETGDIISHTENYNNTGVDRYVIVAKGNIDGKLAYIGVVVKSYPRQNLNNKFYLHEAEIIKTGSPVMTDPQTSEATVSNSVSNNTIPQNHADVNPSDKKSSEVRDSRVAVKGVYYTPEDRTLISEHPTITATRIENARYRRGERLSPEDYKAYRTAQAREAEKKRGIYTNKDTSYSDKYGEIVAEFGTAAIRKGKSHGGTAILDILPYVGEIFENAIVIHTRQDRDSDPHIRGIVELVGCASLNGKDIVVVKLNVKEYTNNEAKIYENRVLEIEELTVLDGEGHISDGASTAVSSDYIIHAYRRFVNPSDKKSSEVRDSKKKQTPEEKAAKELVRRETKLQKREAEADRRENEIKTKKKELKAGQKDVTAREKEVKKRENAVGKKEVRVDKQQDKLKNNTEKLSAKTVKVKADRQKLQEQRERLRERRERLNQRSQRLKERTERVRQREAAIREGRAKLYIARKKLKAAYRRKYWLDRALEKAKDIRTWNKNELKAVSQVSNNVILRALETINKTVRGDVISNQGTRNAMRDILEWYRQPGVQELFLGVVRNEQGEVKERGIYLESIEEAIESIATGKGVLNEDDAENLYHILKHLRKITVDAHKVYSYEGSYEDSREISRRYKGKTKNRQTNLRYYRGIRAMLQKLGIEIADPMTLMRYFDGYADAFLTDSWEAFRVGETNRDYILHDLMTPLRAFMQKYPKYFNKAKKQTVTVKKVKMTLGEALSLHESLLTDQALMHLLKNKIEYKKSNGQADFREGLFPEIQSLDAEDRKNPDKIAAKYAEMREIAAPIIQEIEAQLTDADFELLAISADLLDGKCKKLKKDTDEKNFGCTNVRNSKYFPLKSSGKAVSVDSSGMLWDMDSATHASFNKNTSLLSSNSLVIEDLWEVLIRHINGIANYAALSTTIITYNKLLYVDSREHKQGADITRRTTIDTTPDNLYNDYIRIWKEHSSYFRDAVKDIQGMGTGRMPNSIEKALDTLRSRHAVAVLGTNPKTLFTQVSSLIASTAILEPKYVAKGLSMKLGKEGAAVMDEHCVLAMLRNAENQAVRAEGVLDKVSKVGEAMTKGISIMDRWVITRLWNACLLQTADENHLALNSEENRKKAGELLAKIIYETQNNAQATEKTKLARGGFIGKTFSTFKGDAVKTIGRVFDAIGEFRAVKGDPVRRKIARRKMHKAMSALVVQAIYLAVIATAFRKLLARDEEDTWKAWSTEDIRRFMGDLVSSLIGGLPVIADVAEFFCERL